MKIISKVFSRMNKKNLTYLFCLDEQKTITEEVKKRFSDPLKYKVLAFSNQKDLLDTLQGVKSGRFCRVAVMATGEITEEGSKIESLAREIRNLSPETGFILVHPPDKGEEVKKAVKFNVDEYIPWNNNSILRLHNVVKRLISRHNLGYYRKRRNLSLWMLIAFAVISAIIILVAYL